MIENLFAPENFLFLITLGLFLLIFVVQLLSFLIGLEPFGFLDNLLPEINLDIDTDLDLGDASPGFMDSVMSMLKLGRVPFIFTFILFLFLYSLVGLYGQLILHNLGPGRLHWLLASGLSFAATLPLLRVGNGVMAKILPKDETAAVSVESFVGRIATILIGTATHERSTQAKLVGPKGKTHYIQVVSDDEKRTFTKGDQVLVVGRRGRGIFTVIENPNPLLEE